MSKVSELLSLVGLEEANVGGQVLDSTEVMNGKQPVPVRGKPEEGWIGRKMKMVMPYLRRQKDGLPIEGEILKISPVLYNAIAKNGDVVSHKASRVGPFIEY